MIGSPSCACETWELSVQGTILKATLMESTLRGWSKDISFSCFKPGVSSYWDPCWKQNLFVHAAAWQASMFADKDSLDPPSRRWGADQSHQSTDPACPPTPPPWSVANFKLVIIRAFLEKKFIKAHGKARKRGLGHFQEIVEKHGKSRILFQEKENPVWKAIFIQFGLLVI